MLGQDISTDADRTIAALRQIRLIDGGELPEAYSRALYETVFLGWRPEARRYLSCSATPRRAIPDFYGIDFGIEPGRAPFPALPTICAFAMSSDSSPPPPSS